MLKKIFFILLLLCTVNQIFAQFPNCAGSDSDKIFMHSSNTIYRYDPSQPMVTGVNPSVFLTNSTLSQSGLAIAYNVNGNSAASPTFYTTSGTYYYWDGAAWINTGHTSSTVNIGGGLTTIYGKNGGTGYLSKYTGAGNDVFFANGFASSGPYDMVADVQDNAYEVDISTSPGHIYKYNPAGAIIATYVVMNMPTSTAGPGFAMIGNSFYFGTSGIYGGPMVNDTIIATFLGNPGIGYGDMASCPSTLNPVLNNNFVYITCNGNTSLAVNSPNNTSGATFSWNFGDPLSGINNTSTLPNPVHTYNNDGNYVATVIITNSVGSDTLTFNINVNTTVTNTVNMSICSPNSYQGHSTSGTYIDTLATSTGCDSIVTLHLVVNPTKTTTIDSTICFGSSLFGYNASGTYSDLFQTTKGCDSTRVLNLTVLPKNETLISKTICQEENYLGYTDAGVYTDHFTSYWGCDSTRILTLTVNPKPSVDINFSAKEICQSDTILLQGTGANSYNWFLNSSTFPVSTSADYSLQVNDVEYVLLIGSDVNNCSNSTFATFHYVPCCGHVFIPNAFTPNNDKNNDVFHVKVDRDLESYQLKIFDRWGKELFLSNDIKEGWDGNFNGKSCEGGTYYYMVQLKCKESKILKGDFILIR